MRVDELMNIGVRTVAPGDSAEKAWSLMQRDRIHHLVVMEEGHVVGVLSDRDLGGPRGAARRKISNVRELMTPTVVSASPEMTLRKAANLLRGRSIGCLPVLRDNKTLVGILTVTDILEMLGRGNLAPATARTRWKPIQRSAKFPRPSPEFEPARH
ncbi:MAG: CBS domain-containing protein [Myxococcaceae bacterium]